jgi:hypothetical protein
MITRQDLTAQVHIVALVAPAVLAEAAQELEVDLVAVVEAAEANAFLV